MTKTDAIAFRKLMTSLAEDQPEEVAEMFTNFYDHWADYIGKELPKGKRIQYDGKAWKVRQKHTVQEMYPPSINTASLYERIDEDNAGTMENPIPYDSTMAVYKDKYYSEDGVIYKATRDSGNPLYASCSALIGIYFEVVE